MPDQDATAAGNAGEDTSNLGKQNEGASDDTSTVGKEEGKKEGKTFSQADVDRIVTTRLAKEKQKADEEKNLTEGEKLKRERDDLQNKLSERDARDTFTAKAEKAGCTKPSALFKQYRDEMEIKNGKVENVDEVLKEAKAEFPEWFGQKQNGKGNADGGKKSGDKSGGMNDFIRDSARR